LNTAQPIPLLPALVAGDPPVVPLAPLAVARPAAAPPAAAAAAAAAVAVGHHPGAPQAGPEGRGPGAPQADPEGRGPGAGAGRVAGRGRGGGAGRGRGEDTVAGRRLAANNRAMAVAARAVGDRQVVRIDEVNPEHLRRARAPDHVEVLDSMQQGILTSIRGLTNVFQEQNNRDSAPSSNHDKIVNLYKRRKHAVDAGRDDAVLRYDTMIDKLEGDDYREGNYGAAE
jgi:hypothetical protein